MENRFKMRISRMFRGSFGSCRTRNLSDVIEKAVSIPQNQQKNIHFEIIEPSSPKTQSFLSICRPKCPDSSTDSVRLISRQKVSTRYSPSFISANAKGLTCPPASPISPLNPFCKDCGSTSGENKKDNKKKKKKKKKENKTHLKKSNYRRDTSLFSSSSQEDSQYYGGSYWFSSDEGDENEDERAEDETETLFSSRSLSSDSSGSLRWHQSSRRKQHSSTSRNPRRSNRAAVTDIKGSHRHQEMGVPPLVGKVKGSFAVVKSSTDPYNDFRASMVEMIVEKRIFAAKDLEQLLQCFLSLNSHRHHGIIVEVFTEILETLFSN